MAIAILSMEGAVCQMRKARLERFAELWREVILLEKRIAGTPDYAADVVRGSSSSHPYNGHRIVITGESSAKRLLKDRLKQRKERLAKVLPMPGVRPEVREAVHSG